MVVLTGKFDGKSFVADHLPSDLQPNTPVRIVLGSGNRPSAFTQIAANAIKANLPPDFAAQHHHYTKGLPKR